MIIATLITLISTVIMGVLSIIPDLPPMAQSIYDGVNTIVNYIGGTVGFVSYIFSPALMITIFAFGFMIINLEIVYSSVMWIFNKMPIRK